MALQSYRAKRTDPTSAMSTVSTNPMRIRVRVVVAGTGLPVESV
jgi:hypothetical protein